MAAKKRGLGRGLDALLGGMDDSEPAKTAKASTLPVDLIAVSYTHLTLPTN